MQTTDLVQARHEDKYCSRVCNVVVVFKTKSLEHANDELIRDLTFIEQVHGGDGLCRVSFFQNDRCCVWTHYFIFLRRINTFFIPLDLSILVS